jgi:hypothetical protein
MIYAVVICCCVLRHQHITWRKRHAEPPECEQRPRNIWFLGNGPAAVHELKEKPVISAHEMSSGPYTTQSLETSQLNRT